MLDMSSLTCVGDEELRVETKLNFPCLSSPSLNDYGQCCPQMLSVKVAAMATRMPAGQPLSLHHTVQIAAHTTSRKERKTFLFTQIYSFIFFHRIKF